MAKSEVKLENNKIVCFLSITLPTSKVRVKRNDEPLAVRQNTIKKGDLLEWQISYYDQNRKLIEIGEMLQIGYKHGIFMREELEEMSEAARITHHLFAEDFKIIKKEDNIKFLGEFEIIYRHVPIIHKKLDNGCFVEAELKHKQRAVGYQPMLYIFIPVENAVAVRPLIGRCAESREIVKWSPTKYDIKGTVRTFTVLSHKHRNDIIEIIDNLLTI